MFTYQEVLDAFKDCYKSKKNTQAAQEFIFGGYIPKLMALTDAINNPGKLDLSMVNAALARASLDKIVGFRLSPIARNKVGAKSVGRCQSPALRLIVDREEEINNFIPKEYWKDVNHVFMWHGRNCCTARNPKCSQCSIKEKCKYYNKSKDTI